VEHWYVYYKLPADALPDVLPALRSLVQQIARAAGGPGRLQARIDVKEGLATVMEVYPEVQDPARLDAAMRSALAACDLPDAARSGRRVERFRDL
jgi:hypothetical protein